MQVIIRTLDEARESRAELIVQNDGDGEQTVTMVEKNAEIRITEYPGPVRMFTAEDLAAAQASEAKIFIDQRDRAERERDQAIAQREEARNALAEQIEKFEQALKNIGDKHQRELAALQAKVDEYDKDRHFERDRADANRQWAERAEARVDNLTGKITKARAILDAQDVTDAREQSITKLSVRMAEAIAKAVLTLQA